MKSQTNKGQAKSHEIFNADGSPALAEDGTPLTMTQAEWRARDKSKGYTRSDDEDATGSDNVVPEVTTEATPTGTTEGAASGDAGAAPSE